MRLAIALLPIVFVQRCVNMMIRATVQSKKLKSQSLELGVYVAIA